jgi:hypothetical protein
LRLGPFLALLSLIGRSGAELDGFSIWYEHKHGGLANLGGVEKGEKLVQLLAKKS